MNREIKFRAWSPELQCMSGYACPFNAETLVFKNNTAIRFGTKSEDITMQYTGVNDKSGKEIYEGDKVRHNGTVSTVEFDRGAFILTGPNNFCLRHFKSEELEVVGHIYQCQATKTERNF